jgi:hypothetical protein
MTTPDNWAVAIVDGATMTLAFGSYLDLSTPTLTAEESAVAGSMDGDAAANNSIKDASPTEEGGSRLIIGIVVAVVVLAVLLLIGVLAVILSARRSTV